MRFEPGHPAADAKGYVKEPNVNPLVEMMDMREAQRSYEANLNAQQAGPRLCAAEDARPAALSGGDEE